MTNSHEAFTVRTFAPETFIDKAYADLQHVMGMPTMPALDISYNIGELWLRSTPATSRFSLRDRMQKLLGHGQHWNWISATEKRDKCFCQRFDALQIQRVVEAAWEDSWQ